MIEDNPGDVRLVKEMLFEEEFALDGLECLGRLSLGINRLAQGGIDVVLLDLGLPDSQGLNTFEKICAVAPKTPILIFTSNIDKLLAVEAVQRGAQDYLVKGKTDGALLSQAIRYAVERKKAEDALKESYAKTKEINEKLRIISKLTRHDAQNKLSTIAGYTFLLKKHASQANSVEGLGKIEQAIKEIEKIFLYARMYEIMGIEELTYVNVDKTVNEALNLIPGPTAKIDGNCQGLTLLADSFLRTLFYNLFENTKKYGRNPPVMRMYYELAEQGGLRLIYEDAGVGISAENKLKLFTEGFSTGSSTGFGLFLIKKMMDVYGWNIIEDGEPGKGVKFIITIPKLNKNRKENYQITK